jgi:RNA polymerase subunit RPABC4/transcription elongation factor Spt4
MFPLPGPGRDPKLAAEKARAKQEAEEAKKKADSLPKEFNYYCSNCLYQTNEYTKMCPQCKRHRLERTDGAGEIVEKKEKPSETFEFYCPHCLYQTNEYKKICPVCARQRMVKAK